MTAESLPPVVIEVGKGSQLGSEVCLEMIVLY